MEKENEWFACKHCGATVLSAWVVCPKCRQLVGRKPEVLGDE
jgi:lipopolysaccharide biosynthesis regulator YciM